MKKIFLLCVVAALVTSCDMKFGGNSKYKSGYELLSHLNVEDATMLFKVEGSETRTRTESEESEEEFIVDGYWKYDADGNIERLVILDKNGDANDIDIDTIITISDKILYVMPNAEQIAALLDVENDTTYEMLVNVESGMMVKAPSALSYAHVASDNFHSFLDFDAQGNIYYGLASSDSLFLDCETMQIDLSLYDNNVCPYLEDITEPGYSLNTYGSIVAVTPNGDFIIRIERLETYYTDSTNTEVREQNYVYNVYYRTKSGEEYKLDGGSAFVIGDEVFSYDYYGWFVWDQHLANNIYKINREDKTSTEIALPKMSNGENFYIKYVTKNSVTGSVILYSHTSMLVDQYIEFDGEKLEDVTDYITVNIWPDTSTYRQTSVAWWEYDNRGTFTIMKKDDYSTHIASVDLMQYSILKVYSSLSRPTITVLGYRYSDGKSFVGEITADNQFVVNEFLSGNAITELVPLN